MHEFEQMNNGSKWSPGRIIVSPRLLHNLLDACGDSVSIQFLDNIHNFIRKIAFCHFLCSNFIFKGKSERQCFIIKIIEIVVR